jgi:hypothetical protein
MTEEAQTPTETPAFTPTEAPSTPDNGIAPPPESPLDLFKRFSGEENESPVTPTAKTDTKTEVSPNQKELPSSEPKKSQKTIRLQAETGDLEISEQAKLRVKVDNEEIEFTLKDAANSYKTDKIIKKEFSKLDQERQSVKKEKEEIAKAQKDLAYIDYNLRLVQKYAQDGNIPAAAQVILAMGAGGNNAATRELIKKAEEFSLSLADMSDEQKEILFSKHEIELEKERLERERAELTSTTTKAELKTYLEKIKNNFKISDEELTQALETLQKLGKPIPEDAKEITNVCANWVLAGRRVDTITSAIKRVDSARVTDSKLIEAIAELCEPEWGEDDIADVVKGYLGSVNGSAKATAKDPEKDEDATSAAPKPVPKAQVSNAEKDSGGKPILQYEDLINKYN